MKTLRNILILLFLLIFLSGCPKKNSTKLEKPEPIVPPAEWLGDCNKPNIQGNLTSDLLKAYKSRGKAIDACNLDKKALRSWVGKVSKETSKKEEKEDLNWFERVFGL